MGNNIRMIRKMLKISSSELAGLLNCSMPHIYALETGRINLDEGWIIRLSKVLKCSENDITNNDLSKEQLQNIKDNYYNTTINYTNSIINSNQNNYTNYNNTLKQDNTSININYYQNIIDFSKSQNAIKLDCPVNILFSLINNKQVQDYSKLVICKDNNETYIIDTSSTTPTDKPQLCIVENKIDINNTTCFSAMVRRDVLTNKLIMSIAGQPEIEMLKTCSIIGIVVCRII